MALFNPHAIPYVPSYKTNLGGMQGLSGKGNFLPSHDFSTLPLVGGLKGRSSPSSLSAMFGMNGKG